MRTTALTIAALCLLTAPAAQAKPVAYTGKTKEGSKISFVLSGGKVSRIRTLIPTSCASAQGGDPKAGLDVFQPPGGFILGRSVKRKAEKQDTAMTYYDVTKNYTVTIRRADGRISGELAVNWSWVDVSVPKIYTCLGNARFSATRH
jgi:hypothetical protein